jgi:hypothetical protein
MSEELIAIQRRLDKTHVLIQLDARLPHGDRRMSLIVQRKMRTRELLDVIARELLKGGGSQERSEYKLYRAGQPLPARHTFDSERSPLALTFRKQPIDARLIDLETNESFAIEDLPAILGRKSDESGSRYKVNLPSPDNNISRNHAELSKVNDRFYVKNISNGNFLYVESIKVEADGTAEVEPDAVLTLANRKFRFEMRSA